MHLVFLLIGSAATLAVVLAVWCRRERLRRVAPLVALVPVALLGVGAVVGQLAMASAPEPDTTEERDPNDNCPPGFELILTSGVSCVQERDTLPDNGSISYTGTSICLEGESTFEIRETIDGLPAPGTGGRTEFPFLVSCDPVVDGADAAVADADEADTATGDDAADADDGAESDDGAVDSDVGSESDSDVVTDAFGDDQRHVLIGLGAGGAGLVVTIGVARALMRRWKMTPKQLLGADLRVPGGGDDAFSRFEIGPEGEGGYDDMDTAPAPAATSDAELVRRSGGGVVRDVTTGRWITWEPGPDGAPIITGSGGLDPGVARPHFQRYSGELAPDADADADPPVPDGLWVSRDRSGACVVTLSAGQPGDPFHATVRQSRRGRTLDVGLRPTDRAQLRYQGGMGRSDIGLDWKFDADKQLGITHETGNDRRTFVRHTVRF